MSINKSNMDDLPNELINKSSNMDDLPNELLPIIFKHLKIQDLIQCRLVCKRFMFYCDKVKLPELIINKKIENTNDYWFYTNEQFNFQDAIELSTFRRYRSTFRLEKFLKRLYFKGSLSDYYLLNLNDLTHLEQLILDLQIPFTNDSTLIDINLPNLKILEVVGELNTSCMDFDLYFTTPKLEKLKCYRFKSILFADPSTINHLEMTCYSGIEYSLENVQYLKVNCGLLPIQNQNILSAYPKVTTFVWNQFDDYCGEEIAESVDFLKNLFEQKRILKRQELKIYFQSVELVNRDQIEEYASRKSILTFQINNYNSLCDNIVHNTPVDYNQLMRLVKGTLSDDFFEKYFNIREVSVPGNVKSQEHLVRFLKSLDYLDSLYLEDNTNFNQNFFDRLHEIDQLTKLRVTKRTSESIKNYDFLFKLRLLKIFSTDRDSRDLLDLALALFRDLKYFTFISFYCNKDYIEITASEDRTRYTLYRRGKICEDDLDLDRLVRLLNAYKTNERNSGN